MFHADFAYNIILIWFVIICVICESYFTQISQIFYLLFVSSVRLISRGIHGYTLNLYITNYLRYLRELFIFHADCADYLYLYLSTPSVRPILRGFHGCTLNLYITIYLPYLRDLFHADIAVGLFYFY